MPTTTIRFQEIRRSRKVKTFCRECNKTLQRRVTVGHTINPYNKNDLGVPKSESEVLADVYRELEREAKDLENKGVICRNCEGE